LDGSGLVRFVLVDLRDLRGIAQFSLRDRCLGASIASHVASTSIDAVCVMTNTAILRR
jgi:hypothetical protein